MPTRSGDCKMCKSFKYDNLHTSDTNGPLESVHSFALRGEAVSTTCLIGRTTPVV